MKAINLQIAGVIFIIALIVGFAVTVSEVL